MTRKIISDPDVMMGKPAFEGTRITVEHVLRMLGMGYTPERHGLYAGKNCRGAAQHIDR
ncbi:MAG: DUF433 domain-containing protein [Phyllobacteriaceae bacterium]|nr:DUF433 domain-containing protein [Phyllobacteriaceae bacterium]